MVVGLAWALGWSSPAAAQIVRLTVPVTTDANGDVTVQTRTVFGVVLAVRYVPDVTSPLDTGADITITAEQSGLPILTITNLGTSAVQSYPRAATATVLNAAALYAAGGTAVLDRIPVADEAVTVVVADGGNAKLGTFYLYLEGR